MNVPFFRLECGDHELRYIQEVLASGWLTTGAKTVEFEEKFAHAVGAKHALSVNSCTAALHLGCEAAGVGPGTEVLVPSLTFTATAEVVEYLGGIVRLADVDPETGLLTPEILSRALALYPNIRCVMPVHFAGRVARMRGDAMVPGIMDICDAKSIAVVEDAAHAFPAKYENGTSVGSGIGSIATCFSFYANKTITCGEGGMLCTQDDNVASRVRQMRLHGIDRTIWDRFTATKAKWEYDVIAPGYKYNLPDLASAVGLAQLERASDFHVRRQQIVEIYRKHFQDCPNVRLPPSDIKAGDHAWHLFIIQLKGGIDRNVFIENLAESGVFNQCSLQASSPNVVLEKHTHACADDFPGAESWWNSCVSLPLFPAMTNQEIEHVCVNVRRILSETGINAR